VHSSESRFSEDSMCSSSFMNAAVENWPLVFFFLLLYAFDIFRLYIEGTFKFYIAENQYNLLCR
jgi:hypothetical protein